MGVQKFSHQKQNTNQIRIKLNNAAHQRWKVHKVEMSLGNQDFQTGITIDHEKSFTMVSHHQEEVNKHNLRRTPGALSSYHQVNCRKNEKRKFQHAN